MCTVTRAERKIMKSNKTAVFGIFHTELQAERCVTDLLAAGFRNDDISVLIPNNRGSKDFGVEKHTKAPEGTTTGVTAGGAIGGTLGFLAAVGVLAIPGIGPIVAAGPIMAILAGLGLGGTLGGLAGALVGMGMPEYEAKRYEGHVKTGGVLMSVHCNTTDEVSRAKELLTQTGAQDVASSGEAAADHDSESRVSAVHH
jgi:hypothetical protein